MKNNGIAPERLVASCENCEKLSAEEWDTNYVWLGEDLLATKGDVVLYGMGRPVVYSPAPTAEELLMAFNKLPLVKEPEIHYDSQFSMWQVWWENAETHYTEHAEPSVRMADAAFNAYMQARGEK